MIAVSVIFLDAHAIKNRSTHLLRVDRCVTAQLAVVHVPVCSDSSNDIVI